MKANQLATLVLRLMGIYCLLQSLPIFSMLVSLTFMALFRGEAERLDVPGAMPFLLPGLGLILTGILLLLFSVPMGKKLAPQDQDEGSVVACSFENIQTLAFAVAGVLIFASTLPQLFSFPRYLLNLWGMGGGNLSRMRESLLGGAVKAVLGLWLFFGARGFANFWRSLRTVGTPNPPPGN
jgi:hypothetical protein